MSESTTLKPRVSVVMSVHNDAARVGRAVDSMLTQTFRNLELIVINDGSKDGTSAILDEMATKDVRVRVIHQENTGLTRALIRGCIEARGEFIARQDSDDWSHPERVAEQVALLDSNAVIGFVSCATQYVGPEDEPLTVVERSVDAEVATYELLHKRQGPPAHGSVTFRKSLFVEVGGYREEFYYSQDSDLWLRMAENSLIGYVPSVRYMHRKEIVSTSGAQRVTQRAFAEFGHRCRQARVRGESEEAYLHQARQLREQMREIKANTESNDRNALDAAAYLLGSQLSVNRDARARRYLWPIIRRQPWHWRAWIRLLQSLWSGRELSKKQP